jgi:hypothetical protein
VIDSPSAHHVMLILHSVHTHHINISYYTAPLLSDDLGDSDLSDPCNASSSISPPPVTHPSILAATPRELAAAMKSPLHKSAQMKGRKTPANTGDESSSPRKRVLSLSLPANPKKSKTAKTSAQGSRNPSCHASTIAPRCGGACPNTRSQHDDESVSGGWEA